MNEPTSEEQNGKGPFVVVAGDVINLFDTPDDLEIFDFVPLLDFDDED